MRSSGFHVIPPYEREDAVLLFSRLFVLKWTPLASAEGRLSVFLFVVGCSKAAAE